MVNKKLMKVWKFAIAEGKSDKFKKVQPFKVGLLSDFEGGFSSLSSTSDTAPSSNKKN
jgi:hypothetical protein